ncbi:hypothetical protein [Nocardia sp. CA-120079]|uniref:hypothetical protein n=1 Tax=Nocardia sp. CA-120079 TaxID=3239974 RepID=UPI003D98BCB9
MNQPKAIDDGIAIDRAWQIGRRIYVRCSYESILGGQMRQIGANWDRELRRLWVGSGKRARVIEMVRAADERAQQIAQIKATGRAVVIPFEWADIRARAKNAGAIWNENAKTWVFPAETEFDAAYDEISGQLTARRNHEKAEAEATEQRHAEQRQQQRAAEAAAAEEADEARRAQLVAESERTATGEISELRLISTRRMNKATATDLAHPLGALVRLGDGRRGIVIDRQVWFTNDDMASSVCWHPQTHDEAHWDLLHHVAVVEPTAEEQAADAAAAAEHADAAEIHQLVETVSRTGVITADWNRFDDQVGAIRCRYGTTAMNDGGTLILAGDRLVFQHPGYYDDYIRTERVSADPDLIARVQAVLAGGTRKRSIVNQTTYSYEVRARDGGD